MKTTGPDLDAKMNMKCILTIIAILMAAICASRVFWRQEADRGLAWVDGTPISEATFRFWWDRDRPTEDTETSRRAVLDGIIERTAVANQARQAGIDRDPEVIEAIESLLIARMKELELQPKLKAVSVSDEEAREYYDAELDNYTSAPEQRLAVLWFNSRGVKPLEARYRPRLEAVRKELLENPASIPVEQGFASLALRHSEHRASRIRGGDLGWLETRTSNDPWRNEVGRIAADLVRPGELSEIVSGEHGLFLVRLIGRRDAAVQPFEDVKPRIVARLEQVQRARLSEGFMSLRGTGERVSIQEDRLSALTGLRTREVAAEGVPGLPQTHLSMR